MSVELDTTFVNARRLDKLRPPYGHLDEVVIAVELRHRRGFGRARLARIDLRDRKEDIYNFVAANIASGSVVYTDGDRLYNQLPRRAGVTHERFVMTGSTDPGHTLLPAVHRVASLLKRWLLGTLHNGHSTAQLDYYLDEFSFRFNRRASARRGLLF